MLTDRECACCCCVLGLCVTGIVLVSVMYTQKIRPHQEQQARTSEHTCIVTNINVHERVCFHKSQCSCIGCTSDMTLCPEDTQTFDFDNNGSAARAWCCEREICCARIEWTGCWVPYRECTKDGCRTKYYYMEHCLRQCVDVEVSKSRCFIEWGICFDLYAYVNVSRLVAPTFTVTQHCNIPSTSKACRDMFVQLTQNGSMRACWVNRQTGMVFFQNPVNNDSITNAYVGFYIGISFIFICILSSCTVICYTCYDCGRYYWYVRKHGQRQRQYSVSMPSTIRGSIISTTIESV